MPVKPKPLLTKSGLVSENATVASSSPLVVVVFFGHVTLKDLTLISTSWLGLGQ